MSTRSSGVAVDRVLRKSKRLALWLVCLALPAGALGQAVDTAPDEGPSPETVASAPKLKLPDFNSDIYYKNKLEFSLESGMLWINVPFVFDVFVGGDYSQRPYHYTLVPIFPSLRWQFTNINGPWILRGNSDVSATFSYTAITRGYETRYGAFDLGIRRNFVPRNSHVAPYFEFRAGVGFINAKEPDGNAPYGQGQDMTFTLMLGTGARYNFDSRYSMAVGATYMHVSNLYLSEPMYDDNGINVWGPFLGFNVRLGRPRHR